MRPYLKMWVYITIATVLYLIVGIISQLYEWFPIIVAQILWMLAFLVPIVIKPLGRKIGIG